MPRKFFTMLVRLTRRPFRRFLAGGDAPDLSGFSGAVNVEVTGEGGGTWHCLLEPGRLRFREGPHPEPRARVRVAASDFVRMLSGELAPSTAALMGRIRSEGDGHAGMILGGIVALFHTARKERGFRGWLVRRWARRILGSPTPPAGGGAG